MVEHPLSTFPDNPYEAKAPRGVRSPLPRRGWAAHRATADVRVFGSFAPGDLERLDGLITHLQKVGYTKASRIEPDPKEPQPSDEEILRQCQAEAARAPLAIFVFFAGPGEPNQSVLLELKARIDNLEATTGRRPSPDNTLMLAEAGVPIKTLLRGLLASVDLTMPEEWEDRAEFNALARGWLLSAQG